MDAEGCRAALAAAEAHDEVYAAVGHHPNSAEGFDDAAAAELRELAQHPRCLAIGETGPRLLPRLRAARRPGARVRSPRSSSRARPASRSSSTRARPTTTPIATLATRRAGPRGRSCTASRCPTASTSASSTAGGSPSPATSPTRRRRELAAAAERVPLDRMLVETDAPYLTPQAVAQAPQPDRPSWSTPRASSPSAAGIALRRARAGGRGERRAPASAGERAPGAAQPAPPEGVRRPPRSASWARTS